MPKLEKPTDSKIEKLKPELKDGIAKLTKYSLGGGLYVAVTATGYKSFKYDYKIANTNHTLVIGEFPLMKLEEAKVAHIEARKAVKGGGNPAAEKQKAKKQKAFELENTFGAVYDRFFKAKSLTWAEKTIKRYRCMESHLLPKLGGIPITKIEPRDVTFILDAIVARGHIDTAHRACDTIGLIFEFALNEGVDLIDFTARLKKNLPPLRPKKIKGIIDLKELEKILNQLDRVPVVRNRCAYMLSFLLFLRPSELRLAKWQDVDLDRKILTIKADKIKTRNSREEDFIVPLCDIAIEYLEILKAINLGSDYLLFSDKDREKPISDNTLNKYLTEQGITKETMRMHGVRTTASTLLNETSKFDANVIEAALNHKNKLQGNVASIYNEATYWKQRVKLMEFWGEYLKALKTEGVYYCSDKEDWTRLRSLNEMFKDVPLS